MIRAEPLEKVGVSAVSQTRSPLVQVGIPVFNGQDDIRATVESLLAQDYCNLEILLSDNASTDSTGAICMSLADEYPQVKYFRNEENIGSISNLDSVFTKSTGKYFLWCGHNDTYTPGFISKAVEIMEANPEVVLCCPRGELEWEDGGALIYPTCFIDTRGLSRKAAFLAALWHVGQCSEFYGVYRREILSRVLPLRRCLTIDCLHLIQVAALGSFAFIPSERIKLKVRNTNLVLTARRHNLGVHENMALEQYLMFWRHLFAIAFKHFSISSILLMLPSTLLCLVDKFTWIHRETKLAYRLEKERDARN